MLFLLSLLFRQLTDNCSGLIYTSVWLTFVALTGREPVASGQWPVPALASAAGSFSFSFLAVCFGIYFHLCTGSCTQLLERRFSLFPKHSFSLFFRISSVYLAPYLLTFVFVPTLAQALPVACRSSLRWVLWFQLLELPTLSLSWLSRLFLAVWLTTRALSDWPISPKQVGFMAETSLSLLFEFLY